MGWGNPPLPGRGERQMATTGNRTYPSKPIGEATLLREVITNPDFVSIAIFCAIGLLLTLNLMLRLPDLAEFLIS
jgi:hypothetical protein